MLKQKLILIDAGYLIHRSIYLYNRTLQIKQELIDNGQQDKAKEMFVVPSTYTFMSSLISCLKKVGVNEECNDLILLCCDGRNSWRKIYSKEYKSNRKELREQATFIDWTKEFGKHNDQLELINDNLPIFVLKENGLEADDWIGYAVEYFKDNLCVIVSVDKDFEQLLSKDNVRIFNNHPKAKLKPYKILDLDREKEKQKAYKSLMSKIRKETADNLVSEVLTTKDYDDRRLVIDLITLPSFVTDKIKPYFDKISNTEKICFHPSAFSKGIQKKLQNLYSRDSIILYDDCYKKLARKLTKKKKLKKEEKCGMIL